ncbi:putative rubredoxin-nad(+) reductase protein [Venturia nashicola]|uniref:Putative rubredoxin-nad(+) reductase protein n=1 Tax=Venturia nashicola TaxID=86259 RepID=A0A4Z1PS02_9PEZI|nr:putative rubredoxin-nad(+) reductase protein [Venturia nashicola]TLD38843.1 putative rubredoxin-nad(+) reductase protein [Venturia nashicola]
MATEFKLKGISSLNLKNGEKQEVEVEGVEGGKVLLIKVGSKVHATSANCTHYGAPLKNGVVDGSGRITCPWHGACFNVTTGDVEDAPALDPLAKFEIVEKNGAVYIKGEESVIKANRRKLSLKCSAKGAEKVVIVGGGSGAVGVTEALRENGFTGSVTVISSEGFLPYDRTKLSKALLADISKIAWRSDQFYKDASIDIVEGEVTSVDFGNKSVKTKSGSSFGYTKLVLATGGTPRWLPLPGLKGDLKNVFVLRSIPDVKGILGAAGEEGGKKIVVIGSSFIGMEVANALAGKKHQVSIVGMEDEPMERVMGKQVGKVFRGLVEKAGVKFYMGASVDKATPSKSESSKVGAVLLKDGTELEADLVIEGVGVGPATTYLKDNKDVELLKDGSLTVDETFAVQGLKDVFAIGDIATYPYHGPGGDAKPVRIEHWNVAQNAGRSVAQVIINPSARPKAFIPVFWSAMGQQLRYAGNTVGGYDDVVVKGDLEKPSFVAYYTKADIVVAVASVGKDPVVMQVAELMRRGRMVGKSEIQKGVDPLSIDVPKEIKM